MLLLSLAFMETTEPLEQAPQKFDFMCDVCKIMVQGAEEYITDPTNVEAVEEFLKQVCTILPFDLFNWCEKILEQYYQELLDYITKGYPPEVACQKIGLCE